MNNNFMGFFDPTHSNIGMNPEFSRGPPGQQSGFAGLPPNMNPHGGMSMPGYQHHQRLLHYDNNHMMGPLSPSMSNLPTGGSGIGPPSAGRMMEMNFSRMQHYRGAQPSHMQHSPGSLSPMPGMGGGISSQTPYGLRMPNLAPKQQMLEARLQSSLGNGITRWPRMPAVAGLSRPQMPQLLMNQGPMPMLQNTNEFQLGGSPTMSSADILRYMKMDSGDAYSGPVMSMNAFDFPPSHPFPPSQNPYSMESQLSQPPPLKQSGGGQMPMSQSPLSFGGQPQSLSYGAPVSKSFVESYSKFMPQLPHSPKLTHFGPSPSNDIFDQPSNPLTPLASQQKSPFSPFGNTFNENMNSPVGLRNIPQPLPIESSSPVMQATSVDIRSPTKTNPLLNQIQQLKQQIAQVEGNPLQQASPQLPMLKQQLEQTYMLFISQQRSNEFPPPKDSHRVPQTPQDFYLDKPPMTPRSQADFSLDKPPQTPRPSINDFRMDKLPTSGSRSISQRDFSFEKSLSQPHLQQDFMLKKSPQTPIVPPHHDIFDKPPMTPRPAPQHDFMMEKSQHKLSQNDFILDKPPSTPIQKAPPSGFVFGKPQLPLTQPQLPLTQPPPPVSRNDMNLSQSQLHLSQPSYFDKPPNTPRPSRMQQQEPMLDKPLPIAHRSAAPDYSSLDKIPSTPGSLPSSQQQTNFNIVKSPIGTQAPMQLPIQPQQPQRPAHIRLQSPLRSPPSFFSQASQSPMSSMSTPIHSVSQQQDATDIDLKDDIAFLDELLQTKLNEPPEKQEQPMAHSASRKNSLNRAPNPMPVLDDMHSSAPSPTLPPTMPVLAPSVPPPASLKYEGGMPDVNHGLAHSPMHSIPMPFPMQMSAGPIPMYTGMHDHQMMMHNIYGMNFGMMPSIRPPQLRTSNAKEKTKASKSSALKGTSHGPAAKKKKVRRKSSESDTMVSSPKTPVTPATPNSTSNTNIVNPASNVSSVNSSESIAAVNPFMLDDNLADNAATRRSLRERKKRNYNDDYDYNISDDEEKKKAENGESVNLAVAGGHKLIAYKPSDAVEGEIATIERILAGRVQATVKDEEGNDVECEEFCVKYKGYSYLHCEWGTEKELSKKDKRAPMKIKRFKTKRDPVAILSELDDEPFNPDFVEVDRVLDQSTCMDQATGEPVTHYLVKWRSLPYEDSTWELEVNVDEPKIKQYLELKKPPPPEFQQYVPRPQAFQWKTIESSPKYKDRNTLRDYQLEGLNWLAFCWYKRQNCILADEMGLGKTVQSISLLCELKRYGVRGPFLVIAPLSTIVHWQREFEAWTDINTIVYHGSSPSRLLIQQYEMSYTDEKGEKIPGIYKFEAVVTTYEMILSDNDMLSKIPWRCAVIDEAHRLKNKNCKLLEGLNKLQLEHRVLLTGTPLQNNVEELFSLLNFLEPTTFPSQAAFLLEFGNLKTEAQVEKLQQILKPMMLRRLKDDVEKNVPPKEETIIEVELTTIQKKFYRAILEKNLTFLTRGISSASNTPNLMNAMMELRKCCNHPFLINGAEERIVSEYTNGAEGQETITKHFKAMTESSGKMVLIDKLLPKLRASGHKVLIFSQMIRVLDLLEDYLLCKKYLYERIDGRVRGNARQAAIDRYCRADSDRFVFLLCTRAGGLGINLTAADTVIIFDSDWNPQNDLQAQARCHRIGQSKPVKIYRLICRNTYERDMFDKASRKLALDRAVLQNMNYMENSPAPALPGNTIPGGALPGSSPFPGNGPVPGIDGSPGNPAQVQAQPVMSKNEIEDLLKRGAYGALMDGDGDSSTKFCEEDIDQILERRTQIIQIVGEGKGSTFAKASFIPNTAKRDIDVDDPDFWTKWAQKAAIDVKDVDDDLIIDKPRERKQTKRFGNEDGSVDLSDAESGEEEEKPIVNVVRTAWSRVECFRVEKNMLIYGWGRWRDFLLHDNFKVQINEREVEAIARTILVFCLHHFKGDEKIKVFISSTVTKSVTRSRIIGQDIALKEAIKDEPYTPDSTDPSKQKKIVKFPKKGVQNSKPVLVEAGPDWKTVDPDTLIVDPGYRKHLAHHSKKILSRMKLLWCLRHEIIGSFTDKILLGLPASDIPLQVPHVDGEAPTSWWDVEADKSLLIGVFKHGYDKYNAIKTDPCLCFASKLRLSGSEVEKNTSFSPEQGATERCEDESFTPGGKRKRKKRSHDDDDFNSDDEGDRDDDVELYSMIESPMSAASSNVPNDGAQTQESALKWPQPPDLNTRLRRLITGYLKGCEKEQIKLAQQEKDKERRERQAQQIREKQLKKAEMALRWSRREVTDFYRVVTTFGVMYDDDTKTYDWLKFRKLAKLEKKDDERISAYYEEFSAMCRRVCKESTPDDIETKRGENLEPITDERAHRVLHRVNLLNTIRNQVLKHEKLDERLALCEPSNDFPVWWKPGTHDKEFLIGVAKHGVGRIDFHLFSDENLCFKSIVDNLAIQLKKRRQEQLAGQNADKVAPIESAGAVSQPVNSTAADSQTTSTSETPSSGVNGDRQPVATQHESKETQGTGSEEKKDSVEDTSVSKEVAEILAAWPKDKALHGRLEKICKCVLNNAWPENARVELRSHGPSSQNHLTLPGSFERADLMRQPTVNVGGEDGTRGEMAEGLLSPDKNFKVTSLDGLKITVKKKRRRRTKEQMAAAAAAAAQLAQVPPPEHLKFPVNDIQGPGVAASPSNDKVKRRRKRKIDFIECAAKSASSLSPQDEPPLKVVPHPVKYTSVAESGATDLKVTLNPSIILHVPANMEQRSGRIPGPIASPAGQAVSSQSPVSSASSSQLSEKPSVVPPSIAHSIDSLVHSQPHSGSGHVTSARTSTIDHHPSLSQQKTDSPDGSYVRSSALEAKTPSLLDSKPSPKISTTEALSDRGDRPKTPADPSLWSTTNSNRSVDHSTVISPNVNPFEKNRSIGEANIFDMLPLHMQSPSSKEYKDSVLAYSNANAPFNALKQKHDKPSRGETVTPPGLTKYLEGHKASAAMAALAAKLHSQAVSQTARSERYMPSMDSAPLIPFQGEENASKTSISSVVSMNNPPKPASKGSKMNYRHSTSEDVPNSAHTTAAKSEASKRVSESAPSITTTSSSISPPKRSPDDVSKYKKGISGHPHSMASLLSSNPTTTSLSTPTTSVSLSSSFPFTQTPSIESRDVLKESLPTKNIDQPTRISNIDAGRSTSPNVQPCSTSDTKPFQRSSHHPRAIPRTQASNQSEKPSTLNLKRTSAPTSASCVPAKIDHSVSSGDSITATTLSKMTSSITTSSTTTPSTRIMTADSVTKSGEISTQMQNRGNEMHANIRIRNIAGNAKNAQSKTKAQRATKAVNAKSAVKKVNAVVTRPSLSSPSGGPHRGNVSMTPGMIIPSSSSAQQTVPVSYTTNLTLAGTVSSKDQSRPPASVSSQVHQTSRPSKEPSGVPMSRVKASSPPVAAAPAAKDPSANSLAERIDMVTKKCQLSKLDQGISRSSTGPSSKPTKIVSAARERQGPMVSVAHTMGPARSSASTPSVAGALVRTAKPTVQSVTSSNHATSKSTSMKSHSKPTSVPPGCQGSSVPRTSPQSVIKFSTETKPIVSDTLKSARVITSQPALIKEVEGTKQKNPAAPSGKARLQKVAKSVNSTAPVTTSSLSKHLSNVKMSLAASTVLSNITAGKKPINVQVVTATSDVVACLSAAAALSQVSGVVKTNTGKPKQSGETSVVSTILKVIPSLGSKPGSRDDQSTRKSASPDLFQNGSKTPKMKSVTTSKHATLSGTVAKAIATSVPFTTAVKVTIVPSSSGGSEIAQKSNPTNVHAGSSLLRTVPSSSAAKTDWNAQLTQRSESVAKQLRGALVKQQAKSTRVSSVLTSPVISDNESEAASNAPVASRTRPSTRRITSLSALGPGPMKKGGKSTPVTSPRGSSVTSPTEAGSSRSQVTSPVSSKASATSTAQAPLTIPGAMAPKPSANSAKSSASMMIGGTRAGAAAKVGTPAEKKGENIQRKGDKETTTTTQPDPNLSSKVAALAKLNESIVIQTTRTVTSLADRPKKQKRSLASIVTDLASKGAHQTTVPIPTASLPATVSRPLPSSTHTEPHVACKSSLVQSTKAVRATQSTDSKSPVRRADGKIVTKKSEETPCAEKKEINDIGHEDKGSSEYMEIRKANETSKVIAKTNEAPKEVLQNKDASSVHPKQSLRGETSIATPPAAIVTKAPKDTGDSSSSNNVVERDAKTPESIETVKRKEPGVVQVSRNDTEHNYSEKASTWQQNST